jgi:hypothetical protein
MNATLLDAGDLEMEYDEDSARLCLRTMVNGKA